MKFIDIHTHGIGGYDTRTTNEEDILNMAEIHASAGVSAIMPTIYPDTIEVMRENMMAVKRAMELQRSEVFPLPWGERDRVRGNKPATILGIHLEGPFLSPKECGALNAGAFLEPTEFNLEKLLDGFEEIIKLITIAPEMEGATRLIRKISDRGIVASMGHSDATYAEAEAGFNAGARGMTHLFNAMRGVHHREPGIAGFGLLNRDIYIEVIADPYHLHPETLGLIFRIKDPERIILISDSVKGTKVSERDTGHGVVDDSGRLQGGSMTIAESLKRLTGLGFDEEIITRCVTETPAAYILI